MSHRLIPYRMTATVGIALVVMFTVAGCDETGPTGPTVPLDTEFVLAPGEVASVAQTGLRIRFISVANDSRCPADAFCIQGGDALVRIEVLEDGRSFPYDLHTGTLQPVHHGGLTVALVQLSPYPFSSRTIQPGEYRATLRASRS